MRSTLCPALNTCWDVRRTDLDYAQMRRLIGQWREIAPLMLGDFYPLLPYSREEHVWLAWQFDRPDLGEGVVQVFRRAGSCYEAAHLKLHGLEPQARYEIEDVDSPARTQSSGQELMEQGLPVRLATQPSAAVIRYRRLR